MLVPGVANRVQAKEITKGHLHKPTNIAIELAPSHAKRTSRILKKLLHFRFTIFPFDFIIITCNDY